MQKLKSKKSHKNFSWHLFIVTKIVLPILMLVTLPVIPIIFFSTDMVDLSLEILLKSTEKVDLAIEILKHLNLSLTYLISILVLFVLLNFFKKQNANKLFNSNGNIYYNFYYPLFWISTNILGYEKIQLAGIPLHLQYKLVLRGTFPKIIPDFWENHYDTNEGLDNVTLDCSKIETVSKEVNLIISDTYFIKNEEICVRYRDLPTIRVSSKLINRRYLNKELVQKTREAMQLLRSKGYTEINVFSTANPQNNLNIINSSFRFFGRFSDAKVYVMQKDNGNNSKYSKRYRVI